MVPYATIEDLLEYLDTSTSPDGATRLLLRASELIEQAMSSNYIASNSLHVEAAKMATCAQVEHWIEIGESMAITGPIKSFGSGNLSVDFGRINGSQISPRSKNYLNNQGLLYRGINSLYKGVQQV